MDINPGILDANGRETFYVGGTNSWRQHTYKGYCVSLEWFSGMRSQEPMLVIWPLAAGRNSGAWGICLSSAGKYATPEGKPTPECFFEATDTLVNQFDRVPLGIELNTLVDVVMRFIGDLILMPPTPRSVIKDNAEARGAVLDVTRLENGKTVDQVTL